MLEWTAKFRDETSCQSDRVVFDVLCGDFNFDNLSPGKMEVFYALTIRRTVEKWWKGHIVLPLSIHPSPSLYPSLPRLVFINLHLGFSGGASMSFGYISSFLYPATQ